MHLASAKDLELLSNLSTLDVASQVAIMDPFQLGFGEGGPDVGDLLQPQVEGLEARIALREVVLAVLETVVVQLEAGNSVIQSIKTVVANRA